ncbi:MAG TPA: shikimate kinase [Propionicimonas sp.]|uniref:shikimate kinase n=1 Tax=Propionicimonas sp. TaxID=1955623 RepID=UPI002F411421
MIVLIGFMGAGKTTVGRLLAEHLLMPFIDSDEVIERTEGLAVREIFATRGEAEFRRIEAATVTRLLAGPDVVLALGGGALTTPEVRAALGAHQVVLLDVAFEEALERVAADPGRPMLHKPDLSGLYDRRQDDYREAARVAVPVSGRSPRTVVEDVLAALGLDGVGE